MSNMHNTKKRLKVQFLLASGRTYDFTFVPYGCGVLSRGKPLTLIAVRKVCSLCSAIDTHHIPAPSPLLFEKARSATARAVKEFYFFINLSHKYSSDLKRKGRLRDPPACLVIKPIAVTMSQRLCLRYRSPIAKNWRANVRSIVAARAWSALAARFALTNSGRFCLRQMPHWGTASLLCRGGRGLSNPAATRTQKMDTR